MSRDFTKLKRNCKADFERLQRSMEFDLGVHKRTRLKRALRRASTTLLNPDVANEYAGMLQGEMYRHWGRGLRTQQEEQERLRFLTVLDSVVPLDVRYVVQAARKLARRVQAALEGQGVWCLGVVEIELVNRARLQHAAGTSPRAAQDDKERWLDQMCHMVLVGSVPHTTKERSVQRTDLRPFRTLRSTQAAPHTQAAAEDKHARRKHTVVESLVEPLYRTDEGTCALVHFHGLVDLGRWAHKNMKHEAVARHLRTIWAGHFQVDLKKTFRDQAIGKKLDFIAGYMAKGGNEQLRYKDQFGREQVEGKMWRQGLGRADAGGKTVEDEHGMTVGEIRDLDAVYAQLMGNAGDGFVVRVTRQRRRKKTPRKPRKQR